MGCDRPAPGLKPHAAGLTAGPHRMTKPELSSAASRLCAACGMCCNGVMFDLVRLQPGDSTRALVMLGLKVKRKRGQSHIVQPCTAHCESQCSIYAARPERCRVFECRQLQRVAAGEISETMALEKIGEAVQLVAEISALLLRVGGTNANRALSQRCETAKAEPLDPSADAAAVETRNRIVCAKRELDALLDQEFRVVSIGSAG